MNVRLLAIEVPATPTGSFEVRIQLNIDGTVDWHTIQARPERLGRFDATLLSGSMALEDIFRSEQVTLHRIYKVVGEELRGRSVRVPQLIAV